MLPLYCYSLLCDNVFQFRLQKLISFVFDLFQFVKEITNTMCDKTIEQPTHDSIRDQVLLSPGPVVSYRTFKLGKRSAKTIAEAEYSLATESLQEDGFDRIVEFRIPRARRQCEVFIKNKPESWPSNTGVTDQEFDNAISKPIHSDITSAMRAFLQKQQLYLICV